MYTLVRSIAGVLLLAQAASASVVPSTILGRLTGPRSQAMGGTAGALEGDPTLLWMNPASVARIGESVAALEGQRGVLGQGMAQVMLSWHTRTSPGVLSVGVSVEDIGAASFMTVEGNMRRVAIQRDYLGALNYSHGFGSSGGYGVTVKLLRSQILDQFSASAIMMDGGVAGKLTDNVRWGAAVQNFGTRLKYMQTASPLPASLRCGAAAEYGMSILGGAGDTLTVAIDGLYSINERVGIFSGGGEYSWRGIGFLRGGVKMDRRRADPGISCGTGLHFGRYRLDYGITFGDLAGYPQSLGLSIAF